MGQAQRTDWQTANLCEQADKANSSERWQWINGKAMRMGCCDCVVACTRPKPASHLCVSGRRYDPDEIEEEQRERERRNKINHEFQQFVKRVQVRNGSWALLVGWG